MCRILSVLVWMFPLLALPGCEGGGDPQVIVNLPGVAVGLEPATVALSTGATQRFTATVTGASDTAVSWSATGGDITREGVYTAPGTAGTYTVRATSVVDASRYAESPVTVTGPASAPPSITHFMAAPATIHPGQSAALNWEVVGATGLSLEPGVGPVTGAGVTVSPSATTTYTLRATNEAGSVTATTKVTVDVPWASLGWAHELPGNYDSDVYRWLDSGRKQRTAVLTRNAVRDPGGSYGGMLRQFRFFPGAQERVATGTGASGRWNGWGYVVSHDSNGGVSHSGDIAGSYRRVFVGRHHAIHEFSWNMPINGTPTKVTVHWFFATGRDHPVYAVTFDTSAAGPGGLGISADSRTPYGDIAWDGDGTNAWVDGVKWGDKYRFSSLSEPFTAQSRWDYTQLNVVPYTLAYSRSANAEMGMVQTLDWLQHNTGGTWFHDNWGRTSETRASAHLFGSWLMPPNWNWTYQMCQYEMDDTNPTRSKRLAWGLMYGAVGNPSYSGYGSERTYSGYPHQSYSVYMVMGRQSTGDVLAQVTQVERMLKAKLSVIRGLVVSSGPLGVARSDTAVYPVPGYNSIYGAHELRADVTGQFTATLNAAGGDLQNPIFLIHTPAGVPGRLYLDGVLLTADLDYFASFDTSTGRLWLTLNRVWSGSHTLASASSSP
jgi:hypothetical protein